MGEYQRKAPAVKAPGRSDHFHGRRRKPPDSRAVALHQIDVFKYRLRSVASACLVDIRPHEQGGIPVVKPEAVENCVKTRHEARRPSAGEAQRACAGHRTGIHGITNSRERVQLGAAIGVDEPEDGGFRSPERMPRSRRKLRASSSLRRNHRQSMLFQPSLCAVGGSAVDETAASIRSPERKERTRSGSATISLQVGTTICTRRAHSGLSEGEATEGCAETGNWFVTGVPRSGRIVTSGSFPGSIPRSALRNRAATPRGPVSPSLSNRDHTD